MSKVITLCSCRDDEQRPDALTRERQERRAELDAGKVSPVFAVLVRCTRHFGGHEEGGWWYDWDDVLEVRRAWDFRSLLRHVRELRDEYPTCRYGRGSVLGNAGDTFIYLVRDPARIEELQSTERPRYE